MKLAFAWMLLLMPQVDLAWESEVDVVEYSRVYNETNGDCILEQMIFWTHDFQMDRMQVVAWRLYRDERQLPTFNPITRKYEATWIDGADLRRVKAGAFERTHRMYDVELRERNILPADDRRGLGGPVPPPPYGEPTPAEPEEDLEVP